MSRTILCWILMAILVGIPGIVTAKEKENNIEKRSYRTKRIDGQAPVIDGKLDDNAWESVDWGSGFIQVEPNEGQKPSQDTAFKIIYDEKNLYVAIRAFDTEPGKIEKRLSRRDNASGDVVAIQFDSLCDRRTAFSFEISAAGVKEDELITENGMNFDDDWNPIWYTRTRIDDKGWTVEIKIPFDQLRFSKMDSHLWGLEVSRRIFRKDEASRWQFIPVNSPGYVHLFGELHGIDGIKGKREAELSPYTVGKYETFEKEEGNPFATGNAAALTGGLDGKIGVSSNLTLDFTINPDFGQVEADPSEVNLSVFETYFSEKRPFFIEGSNILKFQITGGDGGFAMDNLFYSRRIGRVPHYEPDLRDGEYIDFPDSTRIIGAFKLSGKTKKGISIAILDSVTAREEAELDFSGERRFETVEPFTNYFVMRLQKDYRAGDTRIGGMFTATNRSIHESYLDFLHREAYTGGIDFVHNWKQKTYYVIFRAIFSHVRGSKEAIAETQLSSRRYYQRPDAGYLDFDPNRTSLTGHGGTISLGREGTGHVMYSGGVTWRSPGLELNDVGYLRSANQIMQWFWLGYRIWKPFSIFRSVHLNLNQYQGWDFGQNRLFNGMNINLNAYLKNYWSIGMGVEANFRGLSNTELRGGPALATPGGYFSWFFIGSDYRKKFNVELDGHLQHGEKDSFSGKEISIELNYRPIQSLSIELEPSINWGETELQYVDTLDYGQDTRYLFAYLDQKTVAIEIRLDFSLTPDLSIQYYGQPFISAGKYSRFKRIIEPRAKNYSDRFQVFPGSQVGYDAENEMYNFDENGDGLVDYSVAQPDFNFRQFRSNLVIRWEFKPGSTLYLVWSQGRTGFEQIGDFSFRRDWRGLFDVAPYNVFLVKFTYLFNL